MAGGYSWKRVLAIVAVLIIALVLVSMVAGGRPAPGASGPSGAIFVTSTDDPQATFLETFAVNVADGSQTRVGEDGGSVGTFYSFSPDGRTVAFLGMTKDRLDAAAAQEAPVGSVMQLYRASLTQAHMLPQPARATQLTNDDSLSKTSAMISDDGTRVLYVAADSSAPPATSSTIHLVSNGNDTPLTAGIHPRWFSDTSFYYIAQDGVRLFDTTSSKSDLVLPVDGRSNAKIGLSNDRALFAFSNPDADQVYFYRISNEGKLLKPVSTLKMRGFWVVFSPDNKYAAIQTADGDDLTTLTHPSLTIVDTATFQTVDVVPLDPLLNDRLFVTAWQF